MKRNNAEALLMGLSTGIIQKLQGSSQIAARCEQLRQENFQKYYPAIPQALPKWHEQYNQLFPAL